MLLLDVGRVAVYFMHIFYFAQQTFCPIFRTPRYFVLAVSTFASSFPAVPWN